jgi:ketosteroid isomerase-like protein
MNDDERAVLQANDAFYAAFAGRDMAAVDDLWSRRVAITCIHPGWNVLSGRDAVIESWDAILSNPEQPRIVAGGAQVALLGDTAIVICRELVSGNPLAATNIFVREDGKWRLAHHHSGPVYAVGS